MIVTTVLSKVSKFFFFCGFVLGKIQYLPVPVAASVFQATSSLLYMTGYGIWFIGTLFSPTDSYAPDKWYGLAPFKSQQLFAATLGVTATALSIAGIFVPVLLIPAAWLFLASNVIWAISEYHKLKHPPSEKDYSHEYQKSYSSYAFTVATMTLVVALHTTLLFVFPAAFIPIYLSAGIALLGLSAIAIESWINYTFGANTTSAPELEEANTSHIKMTEILGSKKECENLNSLEPYHGDVLSKSTKKLVSSELNAEPLDYEHDFSNRFAH